MHFATQLRLEWLLDAYLSSRYPDPGAVRLLDIGCYEEADRPRSRLLTDRGYVLRELPAADPKQHERIPADFRVWREIADASCDLVISTHALEHADAPWLTLAAVARALKPGGRVCLIEPGLGERGVFASDHDLQDPRRIPAYLRHPLLPDFHRFSADGLRAMAEASGLVVEHASMNMGPEQPPDGWFAYSEVMILAAKPPIPEAAVSESANGGGKGRLLPTPYAEYLRKSAGSASATSDATTRYFSMFRKRNQKIYVVGASLARGLALYLRKAARKFTVNYQPVQAVNHAQTGKIILSVTSREYEDADVLVMVDHPDLRHLTCRGGTMLRFPSLTFRGFHPDFLAPPIPWQGIRGSCIAAECWLRGYPESRALTYFHSDTYERLGYYSAWGEDVAALANRFAALDMNLMDFLPVWMERGVFMCEALHPRDFVVKDVADFLFARHGLPLEKTMENNTFTHELATRAPVYPEIATRLGIPEAGSYVFRRTKPAFPPWEWEDCLSLDEFIHLSYLGYREHPALLQGGAFTRIESL